jgi:uncharacterized protein YbaR (Trm112 family)
MLDPKLLAILACPKCKGDLEYTGEKLVCRACALAYPIRDDIPIMLIDEAEKLNAETPEKS